VACGHVRKQQTNATIGSVAGLIIVAAIAGTTGVNVIRGMTNLGGQIGACVNRKEFETEADYVGTYLAARAGYDVSGAADIWRRLAAEHPDSIDWGGDHPSTPERFVAIEEATREIASKQHASQPLVPQTR